MVGRGSHSWSESCLKKALIIHPWFPIFGGGEYLCLCVCEILQKQGYEVTIASDVFQPEMAEEVYGMGSVLGKCNHIPMPEFHPKRLVPGFNLYGVERLFWARRIKDSLKDFPAEIIIATQPSWLKCKQTNRYDFMYNVRDLYTYPSLMLKADPKTFLARHKRGIGLQWKAYFFVLSKLRDVMIGKPNVKRFIALSHLIYRDLVANGFPNSEMVYPPARLDVFHPRPKKRQVVISCRIDPAKHLETFFKIAESLPDEKFILVGRDNQTTRLAHPNYAERLLATKPKNVELVNSPIKNVPEYIEESLVYLYTGIEPGIGIAIMEACGAGCIPMAPHIGGGSEIVEALGAGTLFHNIPEAVNKLKNILNDPNPLPDQIRRMALSVFGKDKFEQRIRELLVS